MPELRGKHLTRQDRDVIESGIRDGNSARAIAKSVSTVTREVKANKTVREKKRTPNASYTRQPI